MQKGVFLLEQRGPESWRDTYRYSPYNWGPYSSELASDLTSLDESGLLLCERGVVDILRIGLRRPAIVG